MIVERSVTQSAWLIRHTENHPVSAMVPFGPATGRRMIDARRIAEVVADSLDLYYASDPGGSTLPEMRRKVRTDRGMNRKNAKTQRARS
jgi:hypothetical protein